MSYTSENFFPKGTTLTQVREIISLLGYNRENDGFKIPNRTDSFFWIEEKEYRSYVGVELDVYRNKKKEITVTTRSRLGRSYWDLIHQNRTLKLLRDLLGGYFITDAGRNRYWRPEGKPPSPVSSGCYLSRWIFNNALIKARIYISERGLVTPNARPEPTGLQIIDEMNPRLFSNNLVLPYLVAIWEDYLKSSFTALLRYSKQRESALKRARLTQTQLESIAAGVQSVEQALADTLSFQRPSIVVQNFKLIDPKLDLGAALRKPYKRRKISLFESIEVCVGDRNEFVHSGQMNTSLSDKTLTAVLKDFEVAVDRIYNCLADHYNFIAIRDF